MRSKQEGRSLWHPYIMPLLMMVGATGEKKLRRQLRRVERPLLHQVLRPAKFKATHERKSPKKNTAAIPDNTDITTKDVDMEGSLCSTAPGTANPTGPGTSDEKMMRPATVEDVNISALKVSTTTHERT